MTPAPADRDDPVTAWSAIGGSLVFAGAAFLMGMATGTAPFATLTVSPGAIIFGFLAMLPMLALLAGLMTARSPLISRFREKQLRYFAGLGFRFTPLRIVLMSLGAGIGEELLFRGAIQAHLETLVPSPLAIVIAASLFGVLHMASTTYMILAGVIGAYLGFIFTMTDNILVPIIAHTVYDVIALAITQRMMDRQGQRAMAGQSYTIPS